MTSEDDELKKTKKALRLYKKRYENAVRDLKNVENIKDTYEIFYQSSLDKQKTLNKKLEELAWFDSLTGLPNRKNFENFLQNTIDRTVRSDLRCALFFIDLDGFKDINDTFGHTTGDQLLIEISERLRCTIRDHDLLARLGGDEFVVVITDLDSVDPVVGVAERIIYACKQKVTVNKKEMVVSGSLGISVYPDNIDNESDLSDMQQLQKYSDLAMYSAKNQGKNCFLFFDKIMAERANKAINLRRDVRNAVNKKIFVPALQPIYASDSGALVGFEALARWPTKEDNFLSPGDFIPILHQLNSLPELDFIILEKTLHYLFYNKKISDNIDFVSINFDAKTLCEPDCMARFSALTKRYPLVDVNIVLELTEGTFVDYASSAVETIYRFADENIKVALDDFGTGYSGLSYLKRLPIDIIKIDKFFTDALPCDEFSRVIVKNLLNLASELGYEVIAEGVETIEQYEYFRQLGCNMLQGYFMSKPLVGEAIQHVPLVIETALHAVDPAAQKIR